MSQPVFRERVWADNSSALAFASEVASLVSCLDGLRPPIVGQKWCERAGVRLEWTDLLEEANYSTRAGKPVLRLRPGGSESRRNFTIAHELGHHYLETIRTDARLRRKLPPRLLRVVSRLEVGGTEEERFCNLFAACILLPEALFSKAVRRANLSLDQIRRLSYQFRVSKSAVVVRINELRLARVASISGRKVQGHWQIDYISGATELVRQGENIPIPSAMVNRRCVIEHRTANGSSVEIHIDGRWDDTFTAMVFAGGSSSYVPPPKQIS
jgi:IrrE N-terminal-like domain